MRAREEREAGVLLSTPNMLVTTAGNCIPAQTQQAFASSTAALSAHETLSVQGWPQFPTVVISCWFSHLTHFYEPPFT